MFDWFSKNKTSKSADAETSSPEVKSDLVVLMILDGFGIHPDPYGNSVLQAKTPFLDLVWTKGYSSLIHASGTHVGLPTEEHGNSEVGHLNLGAGQVVYQSLPRINDSIRSGKFKDHPIVVEAFEEVKRRGTKLHVMGILSAGGVHGHIEHLFAILDICKANGVEPHVHAFLDGRDTSMTDGYFYISKLTEKFKQLGMGKLASISGRFYGMDRDQRWERTQQAYECIVGLGKRKARDPFAVIQEAYKNGENDQVFVPTTVVDESGAPIAPISENDVVIFYNFREDRSRQITKVFAAPEFTSFERQNFPKNLHFVTMMGYDENLPTHVLFPPKKIEESLASVLEERGLNQMHISETEKHMHVTYFFNGGVEKPHKGEDVFNIPSPKVFDYSESPEMSAEIITDEVLYRLNNLEKKRYSFILINYANPDMLGHTGNLEQAIKANEYVDKCVEKVVRTTVDVGGVAIIIADHGNCETMIDRVTNKVDTSHTSNPVPFIVVSDPAQLKEGGEILKIGTGAMATPTGILADVTPTVLDILGIEPKPDMTGISLLDVI